MAKCVLRKPVINRKPLWTWPRSLLNPFLCLPQTAYHTSSWATWTRMETQKSIPPHTSGRRLRAGPTNSALRNRSRISARPHRGPNWPRERAQEEGLGATARSRRQPYLIKSPDSTRLNSKTNLAAVIKLLFLPVNVCFIANAQGRNFRYSITISQLVWLQICQRKFWQVRRSPDFGFMINYSNVRSAYDRVDGRWSTNQTLPGRFT